MLHTRLTTLAFLLLELSHLLVFEFDFMSALQLQYLWIILSLLGRNVEQDETTCCVQE